MYHFNIDFEFNPEKSRRNQEKHGISFEEARELWAVYGVMVPAKIEKGEPRWARIAVFKGHLYTCIYTLRENRIRIISARRSGKNEEKIYKEIWSREKKE